MKGGLAFTAAVACGATIFSGGTASAASAARLSVSVKPTTVRRNETYAITITGRDRRRARRDVPHLLAFIQYTGKVCRSTATAEYRLPVHDWNWLFYPQRAERRSHFTLVLYERARTRYGNRRICAYLYPTSITPQTDKRPLARAGAAFREVRG